MSGSLVSRQIEFHQKAQQVQQQQVLPTRLRRASLLQNMLTTDEAAGVSSNAVITFCDPESGQPIIDSLIRLPDSSQVAV